MDWSGGFSSDLIGDPEPQDGDQRHACGRQFVSTSNQSCGNATRRRCGRAAAAQDKARSRLTEVDWLAIDCVPEDRKEMHCLSHKDSGRCKAKAVSHGIFESSSSRVSQTLCGPSECILRKRV